MISGDKLPEFEEDYARTLNLYFPNYYDIKQLLKDFNFGNGSLSKIADSLGVFIN
jgi:hypothetical protein